MILISVVFSDSMSIEYIPLKKENGTINLAYDNNILETFFERSEFIKDENFVNEKYSEFACSMMQNYLHNICGVSMWFRILNKLCGHRLKKKISTKQKLAIINYVSCEAHRELLLKGLEADIYK